jgi:hypothetical protein
MAVRQPRYSKEEFARRGKAIYEHILPQIKDGNHGKFVAIDIETSAYELGDDLLSACNRLYAHHPDAQPWGERIGFKAAVYFGWHDHEE